MFELCLVFGSDKKIYCRPINEGCSKCIPTSISSYQLNIRLFYFKSRLFRVDA
jgi:hypothetical protein